MDKPLPIPLTGYCDRLSGRPGDTIAFSVSSQLNEPYQACLVRSISADPNPGGPGLIEEDADFGFGGTFASRAQSFFPGSYAIVAGGGLNIPGEGSFVVEATIWPTVPDKGRQTIWACGDVQLAIGDDGCINARLGSAIVSAGTPLKTRDWCRVWLEYNRANGTLSVGQAPVGTGDQIVKSCAAGPDLQIEAPVTIAARVNGQNITKPFQRQDRKPANQDSRWRADRALGFFAGGPKHKNCGCRS